MKLNRDRLLGDMRKHLEKAFGSRLEGIVLYGSEARGTSTDDSDIDFLVLLNGRIELGRDLRTIVDALYPLQMDVIRPLHGLPVEKNVFEEGKFALYRTAKKEGIVG